MEGTKESCKCDKCKKACENKPGWFIPGEAERVAEYLNISLEELFRAKLMVDWWVSSPEDIFILAPAIKYEEPGSEYPGDPTGECVFFIDGLCEIHPVKPFECKELFHGEQALHEETAKTWKDNHNQVKELLGREPESREFMGIL